jgi:hypothetical protein
LRFDQFRLEISFLGHVQIQQQYLRFLISNHMDGFC